MAHQDQHLLNHLLLNDKVDLSLLPASKKPDEDSAGQEDKGLLLPEGRAAKDSEGARLHQPDQPAEAAGPAYLAFPLKSPEGAPKLLEAEHSEEGRARVQL